jgi:hypothetical protein
MQRVLKNTLLTEDSSVNYFSSSEVQQLSNKGIIDEWARNKKRMRKRVKDVKRMSLKESEKIGRG